MYTQFQNAQNQLAQIKQQAMQTAELKLQSYSNVSDKYRNVPVTSTNPTSNLWINPKDKKQTWFGGLDFNSL